MENFSSTKYIILLLLLCLCIFFPHLDLFFVNIMEARNFTTAREMVEFGNWLVPTMNGELRLEKPPLPTWITAFVIKLFGTESIALLRIPAALASTLLVFYGYRFVELITKNRLQAFISAAVMATSLYVIYMGRTGTWDIFCHSFMMMAIYYLMKGFKLEKKNYLMFLRFTDSSKNVWISSVSSVSLALTKSSLPSTFGKWFHIKSRLNLNGSSNKDFPFK